MKSFIFLLLATSLLTTGCESTRDSKANPLNWFGGSKKEVKKNDAEGALIPVSYTHLTLPTTPYV